MNPRRKLPVIIPANSLNIEEIRLIADLRIMHSKVNELHQLVKTLKQHHTEAAIHKYADKAVLMQDIDQVDEIYLWFVKLKEERDSNRAK